MFINLNVCSRVKSNFTVLVVPKVYYQPDWGQHVFRALCLHHFPIIYAIGNKSDTECNLQEHQFLLKWITHNFSTFLSAGDYEALDYDNTTSSGNFSSRYRSNRGVSIPTVCPAGSYCPMYTEYATHYLCPPGTYSNNTGLSASSQCTPCEPGMYCAGEGKYYCPACQE